MGIIGIKKGLTPVIAIMLLLMVTVSVTGFGFLFFGRVSETAARAGEEELQQQMLQGGLPRIEQVDENKVYVRSAGGVPLTNPTFYVEGRRIDAVGPAALLPGEIGTYVLNEAQMSGLPKVAEVKITTSGFSDSVVAAVRELLANIVPSGSVVMTGMVVEGEEDGILFRNSSGSDVAVITDAGTVGIGTTAPSAKLEFAATTTAAGGIEFGDDVTLYRSAVNVLKTDDNLDVLALRVGGTEVINSYRQPTNLDLQYVSYTNLLENGDFEIGNPPTGWANQQYTTLARESTIIKIGTYSLKVTANNPSAANWAAAGQAISNPTRYIGRKITLGAWVYAPSTNDKTQKIAIGTNFGDSGGVEIPKDDAWHWMTYTYTVPSGTTWIQARWRVLWNAATDTDDVMYVDGAIMVEGDSVPAFSPKPLWNTANLYVNPSTGNVGIGTTGPSNAKLHIGAGDDVLRIGAVNWAGSAADTTTYGLERSRNQILFSTYRDSLPDKIGAKIAGINKQTYSNPTNRHLIQSTDLAFFTVPPESYNYDETSERMRITDTGNIGIGTTAPDTKLEVEGTSGETQLKISSTGSGTHSSLIIDSVSASYVPYIRYTRGGTSVFEQGYDTANKFYLNPTAGVGMTGAALVIDDATGTVGIGTTAPLAKLSFGAVGGNQLFHLYQTGNSRYGFGIGDNELRMFSSSGGHISIGTISSGDGTTWSEKMRIENSGNVGIGTTVPVSKLHIHGNYANTGAGGFTLDATDNSDPERYVLRINPFVVGSGMVGYQFQTKSYTGGTNVPLTFDNAGNVGIGTTSPAAGYKLDVQGKIQANAFDVGDITFRSQETQQILWRMFEDEDGLYLENAGTGKVYRFVLEEV